MLKHFYCGFCLLFFSLSSFSQANYIDSLLQIRKTDTLGGKVKTYYSPGNKTIAGDLQKLVTNAILYYENKYNVKFDLQMIVLDSSQWFKEIIPYGFVFYDGTHWLILNAGMSYDKFKSVYGFTEISHQMDSSFSRNNISAEDIIYSRLKFLSLHELGHYFINKISSAEAPSTWSNEFIAWYFANEYIAQFEPKIKKGFEIFCRTTLKCYPADFTTLSDFDSLYYKMKIGNFAWYHSRFYFFADTLFKCSGKSYIEKFQSNFPKSQGVKYSTEAINKKIEANCTGLFTRWNSETGADNISRQ